MFIYTVFTLNHINAFKVTIDETKHTQNIKFHIQQIQLLEINRFPKTNHSFKSALSAYCDGQAGNYLTVSVLIKKNCFQTLRGRAG